MTAVFAFLAILLAALTGHAPAVPAAAAFPLPHNAQVGQSTSPHRAPARAGAAPAPVAHPSTVEPPTDVTEQLPEEVAGRQIDCPDGQVGTEDAAGVVHCP